MSHDLRDVCGGDGRGLCPLSGRACPPSGRLPGRLLLWLPRDHHERRHATLREVSIYYHFFFKFFIFFSFFFIFNFKLCFFFTVVGDQINLFCLPGCCSCHQTCVECSGPLPHHCESCRETSHQLVDGECRQICPLSCQYPLRSRPSLFLKLA